MGKALHCFNELAHDPTAIFLGMFVSSNLDRMDRVQGLTGWKA